jgi:Rrf2 family transcriptional regulator, nitric oxide-sensitive transcriptional repressor
MTMRLTQFTDYALRLLIMVGAKEPDAVTIAEVAAAYSISKNHLMKVAQDLARAGYLETTRGRGGGLKLALPPESIKLGRVAAFCEGASPLVECFDPQTNRCVITPVCGLTHMLLSAQKAFFADLDRHTLADLMGQKRGLVAALSRNAMMRNIASP